MLPNEADNKAFAIGIPLASATKKAASEEKGRIVAAKNAAKAKESSAIESLQALLNIFDHTCYQFISSFNRCPSDMRRHIESAFIFHK